ncbi:low molecular weight protein-tyrosine-phosphatase [Tuberibacillus sp. Marseille-P3662]|uniref:low molecular weight protein-tyrosine-phosphatase n=1 Tax=Tuberibacillus sp. Marseille-P3662 TaxID=1965358 RepID=UPI0034E8C859
MCLGNICRSPMAEAIFRHLIHENHLSEHIKTDSAGIGPWHVGETPHRGTRDILDANSISYEGMEGRQMSANDFHHFDYVVAMDTSNVDHLYNLAEDDDTDLFKLMDFVEDQKGEDVPDPYMTGNFEHVYGMVDKGCRGLFEYICTQEGLPKN